MTTQEFLVKELGSGSHKSRHCSSVFVDPDGVAYSYGYHYPLAAIIAGQAYINTKGYSNTTSKHINWAHSAAAANVGYSNTHSVPLTDGDSLTPAGILASAKREQARIKAVMATKKRRDTGVFRDLQQQYASITETIDAIKRVAPEKPEAEDRDPGGLKLTASVMALGDVFGKTQKESNDWKARMLRAGLEGRGLIMPEDWDSLDEDTKTARLNGAIEQLSVKEG